MPDFGLILQQFGPVAAIIVFFMWRDYRREETLSTKLAETEKGRVDDLKTVIANNTAALLGIRQYIERGETQMRREQPPVMRERVPL